MATAWEIRQANSVLCAILHVDVTTIAWAFGLRRLQVPGRVIGLTGMPYDHARNEACKHALQHNYQYLFFLDSDVIPPADAVHRLMAHRLPLVSGVYHRRSPPHGEPVMLIGGAWVSNYPQNAVIEVEHVGAGCLLVHRSVLEDFLKRPASTSRPGKPWFDWRADMHGILPAGSCKSEDFSFCDMAREMGHKVMVDTSIQCDHVGLAKAQRGCILPLDGLPAA